MSQTAINWEVVPEEPGQSVGRIVFAEGGSHQFKGTLPSSRFAFINAKMSPAELPGESSGRAVWGEGTCIPLPENGSVVCSVPVVFTPVAPAGLERFIVLQSWEGCVLSVGSDSFVARLVDPKHIRPDEEAEFDLGELTEDDRSLLESGAIFYWSIGYYDNSSGQRMRASEIRFRRLPTWTREELEEAKEHAGRLAKQLGW